jgi:hypothetical protein
LLPQIEDGLGLTLRYHIKTRVDCDGAETETSMPRKVDKQKALYGTWWRVPEEDAPGVAVYRKEGVPLPPARGRRGFTLHKEGRATLHGPDPTDRRESKETSWKLDAQGQLHVDGSGDDAAAITELSEDKLTLKR